MTDLDPAVAEACRAALGLRPGDPDLADLGDAAAAVNAAVAATRLDAGATLLLACNLVRQVQAAPEGVTVAACRRALAAAWPLTRHADLADVAAALLAMCGTFATSEDLAHVAQVGRDLP